MIADAFLIMLVGMFVVAFFLVAVALLMIAIVRLLPNRAVPANALTSTETEGGNRVVAVIQAAITAYEADERRQGAQS